MTATQAEPGIHIAADLTATFGRLAGAIEQDTRLRRAERELAQQIYNIVVEQVPIPSTNTLDQPNLFGPRQGYQWDMRIMVAQGFTGGTVTVYRNSSNGEQMFTFSSAGLWEIPHKSRILRPGDRLVFVGSGLSGGTASISFEATEFPAGLLGAYLL